MATGAGAQSGSTLSTPPRPMDTAKRMAAATSQPMPRNRSRRPSMRSCHGARTACMSAAATPEPDQARPTRPTIDAARRVSDACSSVEVSASAAAPVRPRFSISRGATVASPAAMNPTTAMATRSSGNSDRNMVMVTPEARKLPLISPTRSCTSIARSNHGQRRRSASILSFTASSPRRGDASQCPGWDAIGR